MEIRWDGELGALQCSTLQGRAMSPGMGFALGLWQQGKEGRKGSLHLSQPRGEDLFQLSL